MDELNELCRASAIARVEYWRALMLPEWRITVTFDPEKGPPEDTPDCHGAIKASEDYLHADLYLAAHRAEGDQGELDVTIVHELVHLHVRELRRTLDLLDGQVHRDSLELLTDRFRSEEERVVERLARTIARLEHPEGLQYGTLEADA